MNLNETGREILELGVVPLSNMLPEVAYVKLAWSLGCHPDDPDAVTPACAVMPSRCTTSSFACSTNKVIPYCRRNSCQRPNATT